MSSSPFYRLKTAKGHAVMGMTFHTARILATVPGKSMCDKKAALFVSAMPSSIARHELVLRCSPPGHTATDCRPGSNASAACSATGSRPDVHLRIAELLVREPPEPFRLRPFSAASERICIKPISPSRPRADESKRLSRQMTALTSADRRRSSRGLLYPPVVRPSPRRRYHHVKAAISSTTIARNNQSHRRCIASILRQRGAKFQRTTVELTFARFGWKYRFRPSQVTLWG